MHKVTEAIIEVPILGRAVLIAYRTKSALRHFRVPLTNAFGWVLRSREITNYTYELEETNKCYLASLIAHVVSIQYDEALSYIREIEDDQEIRRHIEITTAKSEFARFADKQARFGRRVGWYAFARALKPKVIVETGVDKGLGSCLLAAAVKRNYEEGFEGQYFGTDINPSAGYLLSGSYAEFGSILYGDSLESLGSLEERIDLFINDSDHSADYEAEEYKAIERKLSEDAVILGDNSHSTDKLLEFSLATNRQFIFFQERPYRHWYPGGGIGISFKRQRVSCP